MFFIFRKQKSTKMDNLLSLDNNNQLPSVCRKGGESVEHMNAKMALKTMAGLFSFVTMQCPECSKEVIEDCSNGIVDLELRSDNNKWSVYQG